MNKKKESSNYLDIDSDDQQDECLNSGNFMNFVKKKFYDGRLFTAADFYNEWKKENDNAISLIIIEQNLDKLASEHKISKMMSLDPRLSGTSKRKSRIKSKNDENSILIGTKSGNLMHTYNYHCTYKYKYIAPELRINMSKSLQLIKYEMDWQ